MGGEDKIRLGLQFPVSEFEPEIPDSTTFDGIWEFQRHGKARITIPSFRVSASNSRFHDFCRNLGISTSWNFEGARITIPKFQDFNSKSAPALSPHLDQDWVLCLPYSYCKTLETLNVGRSGIEESRPFGRGSPKIEDLVTQSGTHDSAMSVSYISRSRPARQHPPTPSFQSSCVFPLSISSSLEKVLSSYLD